MNRLADSASPYLRQHAGNPVDWWPWIPEAFVEAKRRNVPVHLSIGYAACHWCHVMARESFSDPATAEILNRDFVSIKVDREERPEVDQVYMRALHALGEQGGWPLTMFLTPDAEPFWGGTYFPPEPRYGRPSFQQILSGVSAAWTSDDQAVRQNADALKAHLNQPVAAGTEAPHCGLLDRAAQAIVSAWDLERGSFKGAPKFPNPVVLDVLRRAALRTGDDGYQAAVDVTLKHLCQGGIYDHVGGGFARYSVDARWLAPHFEKMLYDNGLLLSQLALSLRRTGEPLFRARIDETVDWLVREMQLPGGGFASSLDADTDHEEGLTYVWDASELREALGDRFEDFAAIYDVTAGGNWEGHTILNRLRTNAFSWLGDEREQVYSELRQTLLARRNKRPQPGRDDKVLADWNGLAISGLTQAFLATGKTEARNAALSAFGFVAENMARGDRLAHSWREGAVIFPGVATDFANMIGAALDLFVLDGEGQYLTQAEAWFRAAKEHHFDSESGAYTLNAADAPALVGSTLSLADEATPAATGTMARNASSLFMLTGDSAYRAHAEILIRHLSSRTGDIIGSASLQSAFDTALRGRLAFLVGGGPMLDALRTACLKEADPALLIVSADPTTIPAGHPAYGKRPSGDAALFLCDAFRCLPEIAAAEAATDTLARTRAGFA